MTDVQLVAILVVVGVLNLSLALVACFAIRASSSNNASAWKASERERRDRDAEVQRLIEKCTLRPEDAAEKHWRERAAVKAADAAVDRAQIMAEASAGQAEDTVAEYPEDAAYE
jgi:hypothetical protein